MLQVLVWVELISSLLMMMMMMMMTMLYLFCGEEIGLGETSFFFNPTGAPSIEENSVAYGTKFWNVANY